MYGAFATFINGCHYHIVFLQRLQMVSSTINVNIRIFFAHIRKITSACSNIHHCNLSLLGIQKRHQIFVVFKERDTFVCHHLAGSISFRCIYNSADCCRICKMSFVNTESIFVCKHFFAAVTDYLLTYFSIVNSLNHSP